MPATMPRSSGVPGGPTRCPPKCYVRPAKHDRRWCGLPSVFHGKRGRIRQVEGDHVIVQVAPGQSPNRNAALEAEVAPDAHVVKRICIRA
jgi:hypothetical protein